MTNGVPRVCSFSRLSNPYALASEYDGDSIANEDGTVPQMLTRRRSVGVIMDIERMWKGGLEEHCEERNAHAHDVHVVGGTSSVETHAQGGLYPIDVASAEEPIASLAAAALPWQERAQYATITAVSWMLAFIAFIIAGFSAMQQLFLVAVALFVVPCMSIAAGAPWLGSAGVCVCVAECIRTLYAMHGRISLLLSLVGAACVQCMHGPQTQIVNVLAVAIPVVSGVLYAQSDSMAGVYSIVTSMLVLCTLICGWLARKWAYTSEDKTKLDAVVPDAILGVDTR